MNESKNKRGIIKLSVFILLIIGLVLITRHFGWARYFTGKGWYRNLQVMVEQNFLKAAGIYLVFTVVGCVVLALPGVTFAIVGGAVFGPVWGTILCTLGATLGAIAAFLVGRFFLRDSIRDKVAANRYIRRLLFDERTKNEMLVLMITRLVPLFPYNLQNFAYGITDISLTKYSVGTFLFLIPGTAMYTVGTAAVADGKNRLLYLVVTGILVVLVVFLSRRLKKRYVPDADAPEEDKN